MGGGIIEDIVKKTCVATSDCHMREQVVNC